MPAKKKSLDYIQKKKLTWYWVRPYSSRTRPGGGGKSATDRTMEKFGAENGSRRSLLPAHPDCVQDRYVDPYRQLLVQFMEREPFETKS